MMRLNLAFVLAFMFFAAVRPASVFARFQNPGQPGGSPSRSTPRPPEEPFIDISADVRLTIVATCGRYEQLEPIKLRVSLANLSKSDMTYQDLSECQIFGFDIVHITHNIAVKNPTNYGKFLVNNSKGGHGPITLKSGETMHFTVYPNLYIDMTAPGLYSIAATMELKRPADGRRCVTRSKAIRVEVKPLLKGR
jgi:hypothetical protein